MIEGFFPRTIFTEEHELFRASVRDLLQKELVPHVEKWEKDQMVSRASWRTLGENGFLSMQVAEEYGGMGIEDYRYNAIFNEELGYTGCASIAIGYSLHSDIVTPYIEHYGNEATKQKYLPKMVSGEFIGSIAMTEPGAGSDLQNIKTTAEDKGDYYLVNGSKTFITNGYLSNVCVVAVKTDPAQGAKGTSLLVIDDSMEGFTKGKPFHKVGLHAQDTCELFFEDVKVPKENLLGETGRGFAYMMTELAQERLLVGWAGLALTEKNLSDSIEYIKERKAFGKPIAAFQNTKFKIAELVSEVQMARVYADRCLELHCDKKLDGAMASMMKYKLTDLQFKVADECLQLHGGYGYMWEYQAAKAFADSRVQKIYAGTNEIMKEVVSRKFL
ncbi:MAG: acyl-CoA dehydrogenase family protein [Chitinophagales bacterium]